MAFMYIDYVGRYISTNRVYIAISVPQVDGNHKRDLIGQNHEDLFLHMKMPGRLALYLGIQRKGGTVRRPLVLRGPR